MTTKTSFEQFLEEVPRARALIDKYGHGAVADAYRTWLLGKF